MMDLDLTASWSEQYNGIRLDGPERPSPGLISRREAMCLVAIATGHARWSWKRSYSWVFSFGRWAADVDVHGVGPGTVGELVWHELVEAAPADPDDDTREAPMALTALGAAVVAALQDLPGARWAPPAPSERRETA
jgi:hypothetical protein